MSKEYQESPAIEVQEIEIVEWVPDGAIVPTQVHMMLTTGISLMPLIVMRFKGPVTLSKIIAAMIEHGTGVFGVEAMLGEMP